MERVIGTAIRWPEGHYFTMPLPASHWQAGQAMLQLAEKWGERERRYWLCGQDLTPLRWEQGFETNERRFVGREEAYRIAVAAGQIDPKKTYQPDELFSEDFERAGLTPR